MPARSTRRQWLARTLSTAAGATVGTGVAMAASTGPALAATPVPPDRDTLGDVLLVERLVVLGYRQVLASGALDPGDNAALEPFLAHELEHVSTLAARLKQLGAPADTAGEGIGLSIVKRLCELLDASLELETAAGAGTTFRVIFPRVYSRDGAA